MVEGKVEQRLNEFLENFTPNDEMKAVIDSLDSIINQEGSGNFCLFLILYRTLNYN